METSRDESASMESTRNSSLYHRAVVSVAKQPEGLFREGGSALVEGSSLSRRGIRFRIYLTSQYERELIRGTYKLLL
jgi:hypothetical protein